MVDMEIIAKDIATTECYPTETRSQYQLFWQMTRISKEKNSIRHDDRLDALAMGVQYFTENMALTERSAIKSREREQWELERQFIQGEGGLNVGVLGYANTLEDLKKIKAGVGGGANWIDQM